MTGQDYSTWLTKQQAADALGVSTKTVEQLAKERKLEQALWRRPTGGPALAVYFPDDVARIAAARRTEPQAFVLPAGQALPSNGHGPEHEKFLTSTKNVLPTGEDVLRLVFAAALKALSSESSQSSQKSQKWLTLSEASAEFGPSEQLLRRWMRQGKLPYDREPRSQWTAADRGWRIRRTDLEQL